jgi:hypothetical protein
VGRIIRLVPGAEGPAETDGVESVNVKEEVAGTVALCVDKGSMNGQPFRVWSNPAGYSLGLPLNEVAATYLKTLLGRDLSLYGPVVVLVGDVTHRG